MRKGIMLIFLILQFTLTVGGQNKPVQFGELMALQAREARPVVVLIGSSWCKYCHAMKNTMMKNQKVAPFLRDNFRTVFLDAEEKEQISFAGRIFRSTQGINELARELAAINGRVSYPTLCVLNSRNEVIYQYDGYLAPDAMLDQMRRIANGQINK